MTQRKQSAADDIKMRLLIDQTVHLNQKIKAEKVILDSNKEALTDWYLEQEGDKKVFEGIEDGEVTFSEAEVFEPIELDALQALLEKQGKLSELFDCMAINMAKLRKVLGKDDIKELQGEATATKYSLRLKAKKVK